MKGIVQLISADRLKIFVRFAAIFFVALTLVSLIALYYAKRKVNRELIIQQNEVSHLLQNDLKQYITGLIEDITFLQGETEALHSSHLKEPTKAIGALYQRFSKSVNKYDQIRFIDANGQERVRINKGEETAYRVSDDKLQDKSQRYYFKEAMKLEKDAIYFSKLDLNMENGVVEIPYKPMIRVGKKVYNAKNEVLGAIVLNFLADNLLHIIRNATQRGQVYFINNNGYYFIADSPEKEWGFMLDGKENNTFNSDFEEESLDVFSKDKGELISKRGLFTYVTLNQRILNGSYQINSSDGNGNGCSWKLISHVSNDQIKAEILAYYKNGFVYMLISCSVVLILLWVLSGYIHQKKRYQKELERSNAKLKESLRTKDKFFSIISHDLRSPFTAILGYTDIMAFQGNELSREELISMGVVINNSAKNTYKLLDNLLSWARIQTGKLTPKPENFGLRKQVSDVISILSETASRKHISIQNKADNLFVYADTEMISTVIRNLISNALKFSNRGDTITITTTIVEKNRVQIAVIDMGVGMKEDYASKVFESSSIHSTRGTEEEEGTGLGLTLCKDFVTLNGGTIGVKSKEGEGSTFYFTLPLAHNAKKKIIAVTDNIPKVSQKGEMKVKCDQS